MGMNAPKPVPEMPRLGSRALELYMKHFGKKRYQTYNKCRKKKLRASLPEPCVHQPCHDVESYFWVIFFFLLQAIPDGDVRVDDNLEVYRDRVQLLQAAAGQVGGGIVRNAFLSVSADYWRKTLHPGLAAFAPLITELAAQIRPEWEFLYSKPPDDHLHEAFRRILLKWIVNLNTDQTPYRVQPAKTRQLRDPRPNDSLHIGQSSTSNFITVGSRHSVQSKRYKVT
jgi:hypothetical protein